VGRQPTTARGGRISTPHPAGPPGTAFQRQSCALELANAIRTRYTPAACAAVRQRGGASKVVCGDTASHTPAAGAAFRQRGASAIICNIRNIRASYTPAAGAAFRQRGASAIICNIRNIRASYTPAAGAAVRR
jgi:hypothetical protein